jgi:protein-S-isoprenylcysteine O-methyltransferase Ste14
MAVRLVIFIALIGVLRSGYSHRITVYRPHAPASMGAGVAGVLICLLGIALAVWARRHLGRNWGMPMSIKVDPELVTSGPYAHIRHPIYTGVLLAMLGSAVVGDVWWLIFFVAFGIYFVISAKTEEKRLVQQMPNQYPDYMRKTKMIVPFVY